ncbi:MAG: hypothetical protein ACT4RN_11865 [Pseudonocardia sp.]
MDVERRTHLAPPGIARIPAQRTAPPVESTTAAPVRLDGPTVRLGAVLPGRLVARSAWSVWAVAFAVGVVVFEWQAVVPLASIHTLNGILACVVLLRPSEVWRTLLLCAGLAVEFVSLLPNPYSASLLMHMCALALAVWSVVALVRTRTLRLDRGEVFERIAPFLRIAFLVAWFSDAVSKLNSDFLATIGTCAPGVIDEIPFLQTPASLYATVAVVTVVLEFAIPLMLLFRPTRAVGVVAATAWYLLIAAGGNPAHSALMLSFLVLFLPSAVLVSAGERMRAVGRRLARPGLLARAGSIWAAPVLAGIWLAGLTAAALLPFELSVRLSRWTAIAVVMVWLGLWIYLAVRHHREWLTGGDRATTLRIRDGVLIGALVVLVANSLSPYIGLKTDWSFSQYGNLRTEAGHWNHLVIPEAVRIFGSQDQLVRLVHAQGDHDLVKLVDRFSGSQFVLTDARRLLAEYPYAVLDYEIDGVVRHTDKLGDDPVLGGGVSPLVDWLGRWRLVPLVPTCQF